MSENKYVSLEDKEKYEEMISKYDDYTSYYCPKCNKTDYVFNLTQDGNCPDCNTPKKDLKLLVLDSEYKKMILNSEYNLVEKDYICTNCYKTFNFYSCIEHDFSCPNCSSKEIVEDTKLNMKDFEKNAKGYICNYCSLHFNSDKENAICPNCNSDQVYEDMESYLNNYSKNAKQYTCMECGITIKSEIENPVCPLCKDKKMVETMPLEDDEEPLWSFREDNDI